jgi:uncharacterized protein
MKPEIIIKKYYKEESTLYSLLLQHSQAVAEKALEIARKHPEWAIDEQFLYEAALLHDIGIYLTDAPSIHCFGQQPYISHGYLGAELLRQEGYEQHARVCERHTGTGLTKEDIRQNQLPIPERDYLPESLEEKIICFADKFYSKSRPNEEKTPEQIRKSLAKFGEDAVKRWDELASYC